MSFIVTRGYGDKQKIVTRGYSLSLVILDGSSNLPCEFTVRHSTTSDLFCSFVVRNISSAELYAHAIIQQTGAVPPELYGHAIIRNIDSAELYAHAVIRNIGSDELYAHVIIRQPASTELYAHAIIRNIDTAELYGHAEIRNIGSDELYAVAIIRQPASVNLYGHTIIRHPGAISPTLYAHLIVRNIGSAEVYAHVDIQDTEELYAHAIIRNIDSTELYGYVKIRDIETAEIYAHLIVRTIDSAEAYAHAIIKNINFAELSGIVWVRHPWRLWTNRRYLNGVVELDEENLSDALLEYVIEGVMQDIKTRLINENLTGYVSWTDITKTPKLIRRATTYATVATLYARDNNNPLRRIILGIRPLAARVVQEREAQERAMDYWEEKFEKTLALFATSQSKMPMIVDTADEEPVFSMEDIPFSTEDPYYLKSR